MERYIAIDVETPNAANDRISAIGICTVEDGAIQSRFYTLVDPETYFRALQRAAHRHHPGYGPGPAYL